MGFLFRTAFWLALATIILPPQARLGGNAGTSLDQIDVSQALSELGDNAWSIGERLANTCSTNPGLCQAGQDLWTTSVATATKAMTDVDDSWHTAEDEEPRLAELHPQKTKKIQARVE